MECEMGDKNFILHCNSAEREKELATEVGSLNRKVGYLEGVVEMIRSFPYVITPDVLEKAMKRYEEHYQIRP